MMSIEGAAVFAAKDNATFSYLIDSTQNTSYSVYECLYDTRILPHALNGKEAKKMKPGSK